MRRAGGSTVQVWLDPGFFSSRSVRAGLGANLIFAPHPRNGTALALQFRLRVW
ncbi:MAG: hypothetical protein ACJ8G5_07325 [Burkholderiales bacterium]